MEDEEREYCQLLRYCTKINELEKRKEDGKKYKIIGEVIGGEGIVIQELEEGEIG